MRLGSNQLFYGDDLMLRNRIPTNSVDLGASQLHVRTSRSPRRQSTLTDTKTKRDRSVSRLRHGGRAPGTPRRQAEERLAASTAYQDGTGVFARADGIPPDRKWLSYRFKRLAKQVGTKQKIRGPTPPGTPRRPWT